MQCKQKTTGTSDCTQKKMSLSVQKKYISYLDQEPEDRPFTPRLTSCHESRDTISSETIVTKSEGILPAQDSAVFTDTDDVFRARTHAYSGDVSAVTQSYVCHLTFVILPHLEIRVSSLVVSYRLTVITLDID